MPRSTIEVQVLGLARLQKLNAELVIHRDTLIQLDTVYSRFNAAMATASGTVNSNTAAVKANTNAITKQVEAHKNAKSALSAVGTGFANLSAGIVAVGVMSAAFAAKFESNLVKIRNNTTMTNAEFVNMRKSVLDLGSRSGQAFDDIANGYMHAANFGYKFADAQRIVTTANLAAVATGAKTSDIAQLLAKTMRENGIAIGDTAVTMNKLWYAAANSDAKMQQFVETGGRAFAMAGALGVSFNETAAALSLYNTRLKSSDATTQFINDLNKLLNQSKKTKDELAYVYQKTGVDLPHAFSLAGLRAVGLSGVFDMVRQAAKILGVPVAQLANDLFPNLRGTIGAIIGTSDSGITGLKERMAELAKLESGQLNPIQDANNRQMQTAEQQFKVLSNTLKAQFLPIGNQFLKLATDMIPVMKDVAKDVEIVMRAFNNLPKPVKEAIVVIGTLRLGMLALGIPIGPLTTGILRLVGAIGKIAPVAVEAEAGIAGVSAAAGGAGGIAGFIGKAKGLIGGAATSAIGGAGLTVGATYLLGQAGQHALWNGVPTISGTTSTGETSTHGYPGNGGTNIDPRTGKVILPFYGPPKSLMPPPDTSGGLSKTEQDYNDVAMKIYDLQHAKPIMPPKDKADREAKRAADAQEKLADKISELNKTISGQIFGLSHNEWQTQRHDAVEQAHDWATQEGATQTTRNLAHIWLGKTISKVDKDENATKTNNIVEFIKNFQETKQQPYDAGQAAVSTVMGAYDNLFQWPSVSSLNAAAQQQERDAADEAAQQRASAVKFAAMNMARDNVSALAAIAPGTSGSSTSDEMSQMISLMRQRSVQTKYANSIQDIIAGGGAVDTKLPDELQKTQDKITVLNERIAALTEKIQQGTTAAFGGQTKPLSAKQNADTTAGVVIAAMQEGQKAFGVFGKFGSGIGGAIGGGLAAAGVKGANKYLDAVGGAVGAFETGQQQGVLGGTISGAGSGAAIGAAFGPGGAAIGAIAGGALGFIGGLFGGHHTPRPIDKETNPSDYNAPSAFTEAAYRYRATGGKGWTAQQLGLNLANPQLPPVVNVFVDGVKTSVQTALTQQTSLQSSSLTNATINSLQPV